MQQCKRMHKCEPARAYACQQIFYFLFLYFTYKAQIQKHTCTYTTIEEQVLVNHATPKVSEIL